MSGTGRDDLRFQSTCGPSSREEDESGREPGKDRGDSYPGFIEQVSEDSDDGEYVHDMTVDPEKERSVSKDWTLKKCNWYLTWNRPYTEGRYSLV